MGTRKKKRKGKKPEERRSRFATVRATFFSLLAACVIVYLAGFFFVRTDGFRAYLEDQVEKRLGERIEIGTSRCTPGGDLVLGGLTIAGPDTSARPLAEAHSARVNISYRDLFTGGLMAAVETIEVTGWHIDFRANAQGQWQPASLAVAGNLLGQWGGLDVPVAYPGGSTDASTTTIPEGKPSADDPPSVGHIAFDLKEGALSWWVRDADTPMARVEGIRFAQTPLNLPTQSASHYHLHVDDATFAGHGGLRELDVEVLRTGGRYFVLDLQAVRRAADDRDRPRASSRQDPPPAAREAEVPATEFDDAEALQARIRRELEAALEE